MDDTQKETSESNSPQAGMFVIRVRECSTRHHVLREVLGYHASTVRKQLMDAGHTKNRI